MRNAAASPDILKIVAIGASAGGVEAICHLLSRLPADLPACVIVVLHRPVEHASHLGRILARASALKVVVVHDNEAVKPGECIVGLPDRHIVLGKAGHIETVPDGFYRSHNIDTLFYSVAMQSGRHAIGVLLTGALKDGVLGLRAIKHAGGIALVQDPDEAQHPGMPRSAMELDGWIDLVAPLDDLADEICALLGVVSSSRNRARTA